MEYINIPEGYVIDGGIPIFLWAKFKNPIIPIRPGEEIDNPETKEARRYLDGLLERYGEDIRLAMIQDKAFFGEYWVMYPFSKYDFLETSRDIEMEMMDAFDGRDFGLFEIRRCTFLAEFINSEEE